MADKIIQKSKMGGLRAGQLNGLAATGLLNWLAATGLLNWLAATGLLNWLAATGLLKLWLQAVIAGRDCFLCLLKP